MKRRFLKWGLVSLVLVLVLAGCPKANEPKKTAVEDVMPPAGGEETLEIRLPTAARGYSMEAIRTNTDPHYLQDVTVYLKYAGDPLFTYAWTSEEIANKRKLIPNGGIPELVLVTVNGQSIADGQFANTTDFTEEYQSITIESQNLSLTLETDDSLGNLAGDYGTSQTVMILGRTFNTTVHPTLDNTRQAAVVLSSAVSRFELGTLKAEVPADLTSLTVDAIYVNNYHPTLALAETIDIDPYTWETNKPSDGHWSKTTGNADFVTSYEETMCYAFQVFPPLVPQFIYEVSGTLADGVRLTDGTTGSFSGKYVTITGFAEFSENSPPLEHTIYKIGLTDGGIAVGVDNITELPGIEANALEVTITMAPWNEVTITPEIF